MLEVVENELDARQITLGEFCQLKPFIQLFRRKLFQQRPEQGADERRCQHLIAVKRQIHPLFGFQRRRDKARHTRAVVFEDTVFALDNARDFN